MNLFIKHLDFLLDKEDKKIILNWIAALVQRPNLKIKKGLIIQGCEGCGKTYMSVVLNMILVDKTTIVNKESLKYKFNCWHNDKNLAFVEDGKYRSILRNKTLLSKLRNIIKNDFVEVKCKYKKLVLKENITNYLILTTEIKNILVEKNDDDFYIIFSKHQSYDKMAEYVGGEEALSEYFRNLFDWTKNNSNEISNYFLNYKTDDDIIY